MTSIIDTIYAAGDDALGMEFQVSLGPIPYLDTVTNSMMRVTTCEIPAVRVGTYEVLYKTEKLVKSNGRNETEKEFSIEFRVDKYYALYKAFRLWHAALINPVNGGSSMDSIAGGVSALRIPITVTTGTYDVLGKFIPTLQAWLFRGCFPIEVGGVNLDNQSGDPLMCTIRFGYMTMI